MTGYMHIRNSKNTFTLCGLRYNGYKHTSMPLSSVGQLAEENRPLMCEECFDREPLYALAGTDLEGTEPLRGQALLEHLHRQLDKVL